MRRVTRRLEMLAGSQHGHKAAVDRRGFLKACAGLATLSVCSTPASADQNWDYFKRQFIVGGARVIDTGNNDVSHSEGQGWGLLFAQSNNDRETFRKLWEWTSASLQRSDGLFSWKWSPRLSNPVPDKNNATDGDLLIAWALIRAARRWNEPGWLEPARRIQAAILDKLLYDAQGRVLLMPGVEGFVRGSRRIVNLSYYVWLAIHEFAEQFGDQGRWRRLDTDGLWLLDNAAFAHHGLPPDWLLYGNQEFRIADGWPPHFGFDAIRIPLYLAWRNDRVRLGRFLAAWRAPRFGGRPPAWINLIDGSSAPFASSGGYGSVAAVTEFVAGGMAGPLPFAQLLKSDDYYSASLKLLSNMVVQEVAGKA
jgi:endoglucanase